MADASSDLQSSIPYASLTPAMARRDLRIKGVDPGASIVALLHGKVLLHRGLDAILIPLFLATCKSCVHSHHATTHRAIPSIPQQTQWKQDQSRRPLGQRLRPRIFRDQPLRNRVSYSTTFTTSCKTPIPTSTPSPRQRSAQHWTSPAPTTSSPRRPRHRIAISRLFRAVSSPSTT
jgi:hypothetical protein